MHVPMCVYVCMCVCSYNQKPHPNPTMQSNPQQQGPRACRQSGPLLGFFGQTGTSDLSLWIIPEPTTCCMH